MLKERGRFLQLNITKHWKYKKQHRARVLHWGVLVTTKWQISADAPFNLKSNTEKTGMQNQAWGILRYPKESVSYLHTNQIKTPTLSNAAKSSCLTMTSYLGVIAGSKVTNVLRPLPNLLSRWSYRTVCGVDFVTDHFVTIFWICTVWSNVSVASRCTYEARDEQLVWT